MSEEYDTNEYLITNSNKVFDGNALELMTALYKAEQLPVRVRLYAASKAVEFESDKSGRTLEEIREEVRRELIEADKDDGWKEKLEADVKRLRAIIIEARDRQLKAWVAAGVLSEEAAHKVRGMWADNADRPFHIEDLAMPGGGRTWDQYSPRISEIRPPNPASVVIRKAPSPPTIDATDSSSGGDELETPRNSAVPGAAQSATSAFCPQSADAASPDAQLQPASREPATSGLFDHPGLQSQPAEPEIDVPTRRSDGRPGIRYVTLKR